MKKCSQCGELKPLGSFNTDKRHSDGLTSHCKACQNKRSRKWQLKLKEAGKCQHCGNLLDTTSTTCCSKCSSKYNKRVLARSRAFVARVGAYFGDTCAICGEHSTDYEIYDCHHVDPGEKEHQISWMRHKDWDTEVLPELEKCVYLCRNCHARIHSGRFSGLILTPGKTPKKEAA